jgi:hypothetical protein
MSWQELKAGPRRALEHPGLEQKICDIFHDRFYTTFWFICKEALLPLICAIGENLFLGRLVLIGWKSFRTTRLRGRAGSSPGSFRAAC